METAIWLASIFGPFMTIVGLWMLLYSDSLLKVWASIKSTPGALYLGGIINLLIGLTIISEYNVWSWGMPVLVTLLGWVMLLRGVLSLFVPQLLIKLTMSNTAFMKLMGIIPLIWGLALWWFAYSL